MARITADYTRAHDPHLRALRPARRPPAGDSFEILSDPSDLQSVAKALDEAGVEYESDELEFVPTMKVDLDASGARTFLRLTDALEDLDDVQNVFSNVDIAPEVLAELDED